MRDLEIERPQEDILQQIDRLCSAALILSRENREHLDYEYEAPPSDWLLRNYHTVRACAYGLESILESLTDTLSQIT